MKKIRKAMIRGAGGRLFPFGVHMKFSDELVAARELIIKPENWCQGEYALNANGSAVDYTDPNAHSFCSLGALVRSNTLVTAAAYLGLASVDLHPEIDYDEENIEDIIAKMNDNLGHEEVIKVWDHAIQLAKKDES